MTLWNGTAKNETYEDDRADLIQVSSQVAEKRFQYYSCPSVRTVAERQERYRMFKKATVSPARLRHAKTCLSHRGRSEREAEAYLFTLPPKLANLIR